MSRHCGETEQQNEECRTQCRYPGTTQWEVEYGLCLARNRENPKDNQITGWRENGQR